MKPKRILYVIHRFWPYLGGAERLFWEWAKSSRDEGCDVTVYTTDVWDIEHFHDRTRQRIEALEETADGIRIRRFRVATLPRRFHWKVLRSLALLPFEFFSYSFGYPHILLPGYLWRMRSMRERFDLVNTGVFPHLFLTYSAVSYARRVSAPVICTPLVHFGEPHSQGVAGHAIHPLQSALLARADHVIALTQVEKDGIVSRGIDESRVHVIGAGVDPSEVSGGGGERFRKRFGIRGRIVLQVSTQTYDKGSHHTVEAMKLLWQRGSDISLVLIGQVMTDFDAFFFSQPPSVFEKTLVLDYTDEQTKRDALDACDVFVMPSRADSFGIVYLEAWLYGKPVIGAFAGGVQEIIRDGEDGYLVPFGDAHMLSEYLRLLMTREGLAAEMGKKGREKVLSRYTWDKSCRRLQDLYRLVLE